MYAFISQLGSSVPWILNVANICSEESEWKKAFDLYKANRRNHPYLCAYPCTFTIVFFSPPVQKSNLK